MEGVVVNGAGTLKAFASSEATQENYTGKYLFEWGDCFRGVPRTYQNIAQLTGRRSLIVKVQMRNLNMEGRVLIRGQALKNGSRPRELKLWGCDCYFETYRICHIQ
jgi:hypothetical protein